MIEGDPNLNDAQAKKKRKRIRPKISDRRNYKEFLELEGPLIDEEMEQKKLTSEEGMELSEIRRLKNKESSKRTRKRKKNYMERLESKINELEAEIDRLQKENNYYRSKEQILACAGKHPMNKHFVVKNHLLQKIEKMLDQGASDE